MHPKFVVLAACVYHGQDLQSSRRRLLRLLSMHHNTITCTLVSHLLTLQDDSTMVDAVLVARNGSGVGRSDLGKHHKKDKCQHLLDFPLKPTAQLGLSSGQYTVEVEGWFTCYSSSDYESGALHTALLGRAAPLAPSTRYFYRFVLSSAKSANSLGERAELGWGAWLGCYRLGDEGRGGCRARKLAISSKLRQNRAGGAWERITINIAI